jgi:hypothetical protein
MLLLTTLLGIRSFVSFAIVAQGTFRTATVPMSKTPTKTDSGSGIIQQ